MAPLALGEKKFPETVSLFSLSREELPEFFRQLCFLCVSLLFDPDIENFADIHFVHRLAAPFGTECLIAEGFGDEGLGD